MPYVFERDFAAVTNVAGSSNLLVVHPGVPAQSVKELVALMKANPGKYNYGSSGVGGASHLAMALFTSMAGVDAVHVPYKGGAPAVTDLVGGRLHMQMANLTTAQPHIKAGRLRGLGVGTVKRTPLFPEMPTIAEAGVAGYEANNWNGIVVPRKTAAGGRRAPAPGSRRDPERPRTREAAGGPGTRADRRHAGAIRAISQGRSGEVGQGREELLASNPNN